MGKRVIDWLFTLQSKWGILGEKERRLYIYAYSLFLNKIAIYTIIAMIGTITGNWIEMLSFLLPFTILRQYAGGIHLEKSVSCIIFSGFLIFGCTQYLANMSGIGIIFVVVWITSVIVASALMPVETEHKRLDETAKKVFGKYSRRILIVEMMLGICFWIIEISMITKGIAMAHIILTIGLVAGKVKFFKYELDETNREGK